MRTKPQGVGDGGWHSPQWATDRHLMRSTGPGATECEVGVEAGAVGADCIAQGTILNIL